VILLRALGAFVRFWIDFIVGDGRWRWLSAWPSPGLGGLVTAGVPAWWLLPLASVTATGVSLRRAATRT